MADLASFAMLDRCAPAGAAIERSDHNLVFEPFLGVAKIQLIGPRAEAAFNDALGFAAPGPCREIAEGSISSAWLAPGEWLVTGPEKDVASAVDRCGEAVGDLGLVLDVTHAHAAFLLSGSGARDALAAHCPLDLSGAQLPVGAAKRSLLADAGLFLSRRADQNGGPVFRLIVDQIMAAYVVRMIGGTGPGSGVDA